MFVFEHAVLLMRTVMHKVVGREEKWVDLVRQMITKRIAQNRLLWKSQGPDGTSELEPLLLRRVRFHIIRNARIESVCKSQSCMVSKLRIIWKQTVPLADRQWHSLDSGVRLREPRRGFHLLATTSTVLGSQQGPLGQTPPRRMRLPALPTVSPLPIAAPESFDDSATMNAPLSVLPPDPVAAAAPSIRVRVQLIGHARNNM